MRIKFFFLAFFVAIQSIAQVESQQKIDTWIKVWGFLKYNHPRVAAGVTDWDGIFVSHLDEILGLDSVEDINKSYLELLKGLGTVKLCDACQVVVTQETENNIDFRTLWEGTELNPLLVKRLEFIRANRSLGKNYYVQFYKETQLPLFNNERVVSFDPLPSKERRLLALARYWNAIAYTYPYKNLMEQDWERVLPAMIPIFIAATTDFGYQNAIGLMTQSLKDNSAFVASSLFQKRIGAYRTSFSISHLNGGWWVTNMEVDSFATLSGVQVGDRILAVSGVNIEDVAEEKQVFFSYSNERTKNVSLATTLLNGGDNHLELLVLRGSDSLHLNVPRYKTTELYPDSDFDETLPWRKLNELTGYIDVSRFLKRDQVSMQMEFRGLENIVVDLRTYEVPSGSNLADYLVLKNKVFAQMLEVNPNALGTFMERKRTHENKNPKNFFRGNIYVLVNEKTRGQGELLAMLLKGSERVLLVGTTTSGTVGYVTKLQLPGKVEVFFTGVGVSASDRTVIQGVGIEPDYVVSPVVDDIVLGVDTVLEEALKLIPKKELQ